MTEAPSTTTSFDFNKLQCNLPLVSTLIPEKSKINQKSGLFFHHPLNDESDKQKGKSDLKNVPQPENRGRTDGSTHLRRTEGNVHISNTATRRWGKGLKARPARGDRGDLKAKLRWGGKKSQKLEMQRQEKTRHFSSSGHGHPPSRAWQTQQVLQNGLLNSRKLSQKWNDNKKPDDGQGERKKKDRLLIDLRELVKILQLTQRRRWK